MATIPTMLKKYVKKQRLVKYRTQNERTNESMFKAGKNQTAFSSRVLDRLAHAHRA
jgi:predicted transcriptional regulator